MEKRPVLKKNALVYVAGTTDSGAYLQMQEGQKALIFCHNLPCQGCEGMRPNGLAIVRSAWQMEEGVTPCGVDSEGLRQALVRRG